MAQQSKAHDNPVKGSSTPPQASRSTDESSDLADRVATIAVVGLAAALIEVELIPGILIGAVATLVPNLFPRFGNVLRPLVKETVRSGYTLAGRAKALRS